MSTVARSDGGGEFTPAPAGTHGAICTKVIDLGTHYSDVWKKDEHKVMLSWELDSDEKMADGRPFIISQRYTLSLHEKARLRGHLEAWRGRAFTDEELAGFDLKNVLGKACMIGVNHKTDNGKTFANIASVSALPKSMKAPVAAGKLIYFDIDVPDLAELAEFSPKVKAMIEVAKEWKSKLPGGDTAQSATSDETIPF